MRQAKMEQRPTSCEERGRLPETDNGNTDFVSCEQRRNDVTPLSERGGESAMCMHETVRWQGRKWPRECVISEFCGQGLPDEVARRTSLQARRSTVTSEHAREFYEGARGRNYWSAPYRCRCGSSEHSGP